MNNIYSNSNVPRNFFPKELTKEVTYGLPDDVKRDVQDARNLVPQI